MLFDTKSESTLSLVNELVFELFSFSVLTYEESCFEHDTKKIEQRIKYLIIKT